MCEERKEKLTRQKVQMDPDACMNDLSVLNAVLPLVLSCPAALVGGEEHLLGRRVVGEGRGWVRGQRRFFLTGVEVWK